YQNIEDDKKKDLHKQVAETQEKMVGQNVASKVGSLQYHYEQAGDVNKAVEYAGKLNDMYAEVLPSLAKILAASDFIKSGSLMRKAAEAQEEGLKVKL